MSKRLEINVTFQNEEQLEQIKNSIVAAVDDAVSRANLSEPGVTVQFDVVNDIP